ncbi:arylacetamide deacetylase-like [Diadema setosum]|uniref:arylacetamide deacetylase-like n=1 Tax=Diadema setosum TaxID=31175 RepID=UPI003B3BE499
MKLLVCFLVGLCLGNLLYVPMPADMTSHFEFYWKTVGFHCATYVMYLKSIFLGGSKIDFSVLQFGLNALTTAWKLNEGQSPGSKVTVEDTTIAGVRVLFYQQKEGQSANRPAFIFFHGGGLTIGSVDIYELATRETAESLNDAILLSVDYRLAPEHPFPAAYDDGVAVAKWVLSHPEDFGVDPARVAVGGDSAGGYLAAAVSQAIYDDPALPNIKLQILLFPWLQHFDFHTPSYQKNRHFFGTKTWIPNYITGYTFSAYYNGVLNDTLVPRMMANNHTSASFKNSPIYRRTFDHALIPEEFRDRAYYTPPPRNDFGDDALWSELSSTLMDTRFSPILRANMTSLPAAYIATCGYDPLRDDGIFFYRRLQADNVPAEWVNYEDAFHGVDWFGPMPSPTGTRLREGFIHYLNTHL